MPYFFGSDNSNDVKFGSKSGPDNRNMKNIMFGFKIRTNNSCPYPIFFGLDKFGYSSRTNFRQRYSKSFLSILMWTSPTSNLNDPYIFLRHTHSNWVTKRVKTNFPSWILQNHCRHCCINFSFTDNNTLHMA